MDEYRPEHILVTGGAGFIGSTYVRLALSVNPRRRVTVLDKLTYAGNLANLTEVADNPRFRFVQGDITDSAVVRDCLRDVDTLVNFAAETHVDRSIQDAGSFVLTDVYGLQVLLAASLEQGVRRFLHISTDEVYGDIAEGASVESDPLLPRSPYAAGKAGGELLARAYAITHGLDVVITRGSNTFGPRQYPEKLVPLFVTNALRGKPLPVYGDGLQVRDWLAVQDHCLGIDLVLRRGVSGQAYNLGGGKPLTNLQMTEQILRLCGRDVDLIQHVTDRKGHDRRYAINCDKAHALGWRPSTPFAEALVDTVSWYRDNEEWWRPILESNQFTDHVRLTYAQAAAE
jgi:dTDP-glucose 4,6-dehydratase